MRRVWVIQILVIAFFAVTAAIAADPMVAVTSDGRQILIYGDGTWTEAPSPAPVDDRKFYFLPPVKNAEAMRKSKAAGTPAKKIELPNCIRTSARAIRLIDRENSFDLVFVLANEETSRFMIFDPMRANDARQSLFINTRAAIEVFDNLGNNYNWQASDFADGDLTRVKVLPSSEATILFPVDEGLLQTAKTVSLSLVGMIKNGRDMQCQQIVIEFDSDIWTMAVN